MRAPRIACVRAPDFGLTWWLARNPRYATQPVVLAQGSQGNAPVTAVNAAAGACDVRPGLTVSQARARALDLHVEVRNEKAEQLRSRKIVSRLQTLTPAVEEESPGVWFLESLGQGRLYGDERSFIKQIFHLFEPVGIPLCVGLGGHRAVARVAAFVAAPGSFLIVPQGSERKFLAALPSQHLAVPSIQPYLQVLGLDTMHQVAALPASEWAARFGASGEAAQRLACGMEGLPFAPETLPEELSRSEAFEFPLFCRLTLVHRVEELLAPLLATLAGRQKAARLVRVNLDFEDGSASSFALALTRPSCKTSPFARQLAQQLSTLVPRAGVRGMVIVIGETAAAGVEQTTLSKSRRPARELPQRSDEWHIPGALPAALPEAAAEWRRPTDPAPRARTESREPVVDIPSLSSAFGLRLFSPPRRIQVTWSLGAMVTLEGPDLCERVRAHRGPWVISGGWWRQMFHRLYYEVDTPHGRHLVFYDRAGGHWHLHGLFD